MLDQPKSGGIKRKLSLDPSEEHFDNLKNIIDQQFSGKFLHTLDVMIEGMLPEDEMEKECLDKEKEIKNEETENETSILVDEIKKYFDSK